MAAAAAVAGVGAGPRTPEPVPVPFPGAGASAASFTNADRQAAADLLVMVDAFHSEGGDNPDHDPHAACVNNSSRDLRQRDATRTWALTHLLAAQTPYDVARALSHTFLSVLGESVSDDALRALFPVECKRAAEEAAAEEAAVTAARKADKQAKAAAGEPVSDSDDDDNNADANPSIAAPGEEESSALIATARAEVTLAVCALFWDVVRYARAHAVASVRVLTTPACVCLLSALQRSGHWDVRAVMPFGDDDQPVAAASAATTSTTALGAAVALGNTALTMALLQLQPPADPNVTRRVRIGGSDNGSDSGGAVVAMSAFAQLCARAAAAATAPDARAADRWTAHERAASEVLVRALLPRCDDATLNARVYRSRADSGSSVDAAFDDTALLFAVRGFVTRATLLSSSWASVSAAALERLPGDARWYAALALALVAQARDDGGGVWLDARSRWRARRPTPTTNTEDEHATNGDDDHNSPDGDGPTALELLVACHSTHVHAGPSGTAGTWLDHTLTHLETALADAERAVDHYAIALRPALNDVLLLRAAVPVGGPSFSAAATAAAAVAPAPCLPREVVDLIESYARRRAHPKRYTRSSAGAAAASTSAAS